VASCDDPELRPALPAIEAIAAARLAARAQVGPGERDALWETAKKACQLAAGLECSPPQLERAASMESNAGR